MNVAEMIDAVIDTGGRGPQVIEMLIEYGHMPPDANTRPAKQTAQEIEMLYEARRFLVESDIG